MDGLVAVSALILAQFLAAIVLISRRTELYATPNNRSRNSISQTRIPKPGATRGIPRAGAALSTQSAV
jgi:hypothetical protein